MLLPLSLENQQSRPADNPLHFVKGERALFEWRDARFLRSKPAGLFSAVFSSYAVALRDMSIPSDQVEVRLIAAAETLPLRLAVLRPGRPIETAQFRGDDDAVSRHLGLFHRGELVGIASLFCVEPPGEPNLKAYQLRGMAIAPHCQRKGLGRLLLEACVECAHTAGAKVLWCNARTTAVEFYRRFGFEVIGDEFHIPDVGPHFRMALKL